MTNDAFADYVVGHGEIWCAQLVAAACNVQGGNAKFMDTREILVGGPVQTSPLTIPPTTEDV